MTPRAKTLFWSLLTLGVVLACVWAMCGCASPRKECNIVELQKAHPDLPVAFTNHTDLMMDVFHRIAVLEQEAGGYR